MDNPSKKIGRRNFESKITNKLKKSKGTRHDEEHTHIVRKLLRLLSNWIASKIIKTKITPNQITFINFIVLLISAFFFALSSHLFVILGASFFLIGCVLDGVDGSLARMKGLSSKYGYFLDKIVDMFSRPIIFFGIAWGVFSVNHDYLTLVLAYLVITSLLLKAYSQYVFMQSFSFSEDFSKKTYKRFKFLMYFRFSITFYLPILIFLAIINKMYLFLLIFGIYGPLYATFQTFVLIKKSRRYKELVK